VTTRPIRWPRRHHWHHHTPVHDRTDERRYERCLLGELPAEVLSPVRRENLVVELHARGMTDLDIAKWTGMSTYTAWRIRERLELPCNHHRRMRGAA
jgi:hypothetical protein